MDGLAAVDHSILNMIVVGVKKPIELKLEKLIRVLVLNAKIHIKNSMFAQS